MIKTKYIPLAKALTLLHAKNPKLHDIGSLASSIQRYGFQDPPKLNKHSPNISGSEEGAFVYGNGRVEAVAMLFNAGADVPKGIEVKEGEWHIPVEVGLDLSKAEAEAFLIDHNNLTLSGSDATPFDMAKMWEEGYKDLLISLGEIGNLPETVDGDSLDFLLQLSDQEVCPNCGYELTKKKT